MTGAGAGKIHYKQEPEQKRFYCTSSQNRNIMTPVIHHTKLLKINTPLPRHYTPPPLTLRHLWQSRSPGNHIKNVPFFFLFNTWNIFKRLFQNNLFNETNKLLFFFIVHLFHYIFYNHPPFLPLHSSLPLIFLLGEVFKYTLSSFPDSEVCLFSFACLPLFFSSSFNRSIFINTVVNVLRIKFDMGWAVNRMQRLQNKATHTIRRKAKGAFKMLGNTEESPQMYLSF